MDSLFPVDNESSVTLLASWLLSMIRVGGSDRHLCFASLSVSGEEMELKGRFVDAVDFVVNSVIFLFVFLAVVDILDYLNSIIMVIWHD